jgi:hypothetical protein
MDNYNCFFYIEVIWVIGKPTPYVKAYKKFEDSRISRDIYWSHILISSHEQRTK